MEFEELWSEHRAGIEAIVRAKISNPVDAEDTLQEILLKISKGINSLRSSELMKAWIYRISRNAIVDFYCKKATDKTAPMADPSDVPDFSNDGPDIHQALTQCLAPFINALPADTREVLTAIELDGMGQKAFAESRGIKYSTFKSRVQRGRIQLRKVFEDCCEFSMDAGGRVMDFSPKAEACDGC